MTWVVGSPTRFSCIGLADVQATVTRPDGTKIYEDCIQKIYPLCQDVAVGFSGSVRLGFGFIRDAHKYFGFPDIDREWSPYVVAHKWRRRLRWLFSRLSKELAKPVQFIVLGVSPVNIPFPRTWGWVLKSPQFEAEPIPFGRTASIGSGNNVEAYVDIVRKFNEQSWDELFNPDGLFKAELAFPGGFGATIGLEISLEAATISTPGVSSHFHLCLVKRGEINIRPNDRTEYPPGHEPIEIKMPPTVAGWADFVQYMGSMGVPVDASNAVA